MSKCKNLDSCVCCEKSTRSVKGCCGEIKGRFCNCCYSFKKTASSKGQSLKNAFGRGRYKPSSKFSPSILVLTQFRKERLLLLLHVLQKEGWRIQTKNLIIRWWRRKWNQTSFWTNSWPKPRWRNWKPSSNRRRRWWRS